MLALWSPVDPTVLARIRLSVPVLAFAVLVSVVAEVALAAVLLVGAGLLLRSFARVAGIDPGFDARGILTARVTLHGKAYDEDERAMAFFRGVVERARALPGVKSAGMVSYLPLAGLGAATGFTIVGEPAPLPG